MWVSVEQTECSRFGLPGPTWHEAGRRIRASRLARPAGLLRGLSPCGSIGGCSFSEDSSEDKSPALNSVIDADLKTGSPYLLQPASLYRMLRAVRPGIPTPGSAESAGEYCRDRFSESQVQYRINWERYRS
jgi:hypothetical protein